MYKIHKKEYLEIYIEAYICIHIYIHVYILHSSSPLYHLFFSLSQHTPIYPRLPCVCSNLLTPTRLLNHNPFAHQLNINPTISPILNTQPSWGCQPRGIENL